jgi:hypothetical protein
MTYVGMECLFLAVRPEGVFRVPDGEASQRAGSRKSDTANRERTLDAPPATPGGMVLVGSPAAFGKLIADETEKWGKVIQAVNIKAQ